MFRPKHPVMIQTVRQPQSFASSPVENRNILHGLTITKLNNHLRTDFVEKVFLAEDFYVSQTVGVWLYIQRMFPNIQNVCGISTHFTIFYLLFFQK